MGMEIEIGMGRMSRASCHVRAREEMTLIPAKTPHTKDEKASQLRLRGPGGKGARGPERGTRVHASGTMPGPRTLP